MSDAIDSHYHYVKGRVQALNPARKFMGIMDAEGWPPLKVATESFYLLTLGDNPSSKASVSPFNMRYTDVAQWTWIIAGTPLVNGIAGRNRGDSYQINEQMKKEMRNGIYPLFCEKQTLTPDPANSGSMILTSYNPRLFVDWTFPQFTKRSDRASGLIYGIGTVYLTATTEQITA